MKARAVTIAILVVGFPGCSSCSNAGDVTRLSGVADSTGKSEVVRKDTGRSAVGPQWEGLYETASKSCSSPPGGGMPCSEFKDCLKIKESSGYYTVEIYSVQAYQNTCSAVLEMRDDPHGLAYMDAQGREVWLRLDGSNLTLMTNGFNPVGYCGAHASLDGIQFPVASRQEIDGVCAEE